MILSVGRDAHARRVRPSLVAALRTGLALLVALVGSLSPVAALGPRAALAQTADAASVSLAGPSGAQVNTLGTTFTVDVVVTSSNSSVTLDAAAAYVTFSPTYLEAESVTLVTGTDPAETYFEVGNEIDNTAGTIYFVAGRLNEVWSGTFTLARIAFRVKATIPTSASPIQLALVPNGSSSTNRTDVALGGASLLGQVGTLDVAFVEPSPTPTRTPTLTPSPTRTPVPSNTPVPTRTFTPVPPAPVQPTTAPAAPPTTAPQVAPTTVSTGGSPTSAPAAASATATPRGNQGGSPFDGRGRPVLDNLPPGFVPPLPAIVVVALHPVGEPFERFYAERQGLRVLGNTLVAPRREQGRLVQYFEKGRMEQHDDEPNPAWRFQYGLLVDELAQIKAGLPVGGDASSVTYAGIFLLAQAPMRAEAPAGFVGGTQELPDGSVFIPFSAQLLPGPGHVVPGNFWSYINDENLFPGGWLHDVGLPLSPVVEAVVDKGPDKGRRILIQAFQRTILTYDPLNPADYQIERANVGTDYARAFPDRFQD